MSGVWGVEVGTPEGRAERLAKMSGYVFVPDDLAYEVPITHGSAHSVSGDEPERDPAEQVRRVAEEVTRRPMPRPVRKFGFY